ncbi:MAG: hypothetical protein QG585_633 [Patescibacteria group bacterium]|nr:hypothetical protein [Patescibacteria group bacterium]
MKSKVIAFSVLVILILIFVVFKIVSLKTGGVVGEITDPVSTTTGVIVTSTTTTTTTLPTQKKGVHFGEVFAQNGISVKPIELIGDSRCANGLTCIWAGTVSVKVEVVESGEKRTEIIDLENSIQLKNYTLSLSKVSPYPEKDGKIPLANYLFEFSISKNAPPSVGGVKDQCFVGGCSGQICSDQKDVISNCMWTESYACYATAKCERQQNGQCGWTETSQLKMCLENAK